MKRRTRIALSSCPRLRRGVRLHFDPVRDRKVLLAPERVLFPDPRAIAILECLDGETSLGDVAEALSRDFDAPADRIADDALALIQDLADDGLVGA